MSELDETTNTGECAPGRELELAAGTTAAQIKEARRSLRREAGAYAREHPEVPFSGVGRRHGMSASWASGAARSVGLPPRRRGRKPASGGCQGRQTEKEKLSESA